MVLHELPQLHSDKLMRKTLMHRCQKEQDQKRMEVTVKDWKLLLGVQMLSVQVTMLLTFFHMLPVHKWISRKREKYTVGLIMLPLSSRPMMSQSVVSTTLPRVWKKKKWNFIHWHAQTCHSNRVAAVTSCMSMFYYPSLYVCEHQTVHSGSLSLFVFIIRFPLVIITYFVWFLLLGGWTQQVEGKV